MPPGNAVLGEEDPPLEGRTAVKVEEIDLEPHVVTAEERLYRGDQRPDGFVAGQMIVHALTEGDNDVNAMITALEGWEFQGPKGDYTIRESDHALIQDMYTAKLVADGDSWLPELISVVPGADVAPPEASGK